MGLGDPNFAITSLRIQMIGVCFWALFIVLVIAVDFWRRNPDQLSPLLLAARIWNALSH